MKATKALLGFLLWTAIGLFFSTQGYLGRGGGREALEASLRHSLPQWYLWGLLSPFVLWADRWAKSRSRDLRGRIVHHMPLAVAFVSVYVVLRTFADGMLGNLQPSWTVERLAPQYHWNFLIYSILVGGLIAYDLAREARAKELRAYELEARLAEARLETLKAQLRPHFLFNTLNAISAFVEKDPKVARRMTAHLGDLLRHSLESSDRNEVPLAEELASVDDYLAIQQIRFAGRLIVQRDVAPETLGASVPGFLLQPLVENAVEHGLLEKPGEGRILLRAERSDGMLRLTVRDDGVGLPAGGKE
ncbi:MAG TPA: histidine kinase, partial [Vicinamibacteria bacterium]|nr:histidine kinase [Vicinamibacteria bacterium]